MSPPGDRRGEQTPSEQPGSHNPFLIVSEGGRPTEESRRIVRAQAARASAAQSRVTRARNRNEREGAVHSPPANDPPQPAQQSFGLPDALPGQLPLASWLPTVVSGAVGGMTEKAANIGTTNAIGVGAAPSFSNPMGAFGGQAAPTADPAKPSGETGKFQLPMALPRGFAALQQRVPISDTMLSLLSRTACIDFASPGVEGRLHQLLFDLIANAAGSALGLQPFHPIQGHLRIACTCLTIFQGQRANGAIFAHDRKYNMGLEAAWSEATLLDQNALAEPKSAEASLWAVFIITVTTGATANFFNQQLQSLLQDLQLQYWEQVRKVLLDFIYPVSFLDEPCKLFYNNLRGGLHSAST